MGHSSPYLLLLPVLLLTHAGVGAAVEELDVLDLDAALGADSDAGVAGAPLARMEQQRAVRPGDL